MKFDDCEHCGGKVRTKRVTVDLRRGTRLYIFRNVPVGVCANCGERYCPGPLLEQFDEIAQHAVNGAKTVKVRAFDYAQVG